MIMAALPNIPMDKFIDQYPSVIRDWIEQDLGWNIQDVKDIMIDHQMMTIGPYDRKYTCLGYMDVSISVKTADGYEVRKHRFLQLPNGEWSKRKEWLWIGGKDGNFLPVADSQISYISGYETKAEKQEMNDRDAFNLMDSIREDLWK